MNKVKLDLYIPQWQLDLQSSHWLFPAIAMDIYKAIRHLYIILCMVFWEKKFSINFVAIDLKIVEVIRYINLTPYVGLAKEGMGM